MDNLKLQDYRSFVVRLCARAYSHCLEISLLYGVEFTVDDHQHVLSALNRIIRTTDPSKIIDLPDSDLVSSVMDLVQTLEDAAASDLDPIQNDMLEADAIGFDASVQLTYAQLREMRERDLGTDESPVEAVASMLRDSGLDRCAVVGAAKRPLADRVRDRRKRRKWLRTPDGQAYLRTKARRRRRPHRIDPHKSKIARKSAQLYSDER